MSFTDDALEQPGDAAPVAVRLTTLMCHKAVHRLRFPSLRQKRKFGRPRPYRKNNAVMRLALFRLLSARELSCVMQTTAICLSPVYWMVAMR